jgi:hypothetical protein
MHSWLCKGASKEARHCQWCEGGLHCGCQASRAPRCARETVTHLTALTHDMTPAANCRHTRLSKALGLSPHACDCCLPQQGRDGRRKPPADPTQIWAITQPLTPTLTFVCVAALAMPWVV